MAIIVGSKYDFDTGTTLYPCVVGVDDTDFLVAWRASSVDNELFARVGTVSGTTVTFGSGVSTTMRTSVVGADMLTPTTAIVAGKDALDGDDLNAFVLTVSGTSIAVGPKQTISEPSTADWAFVRGMNSTQAIMGWRYGSKTRFKVATVSGTTISVGSEVNIDNSNAPRIVRISPTKFVVSYITINQVGVRVGTIIAGPSITFGDEVIVGPSSGILLENGIINLDDSRIAVTYPDSDDGYAGKAQVGVVSGTSITFVASGTFNAGHTDVCKPIAYEGSDGGIAVFYDDADDGGKLKVSLGSLSGTAINFGPEELVEANNVDEIWPAIINGPKTVVAFQDQGGGNDGSLRIVDLETGYLLSASGNLFTSGPELITASSNLFIEGRTSIAASGNLLTQGYENTISSGNLYTTGHEFVDTSGNLFVQGTKTQSGVNDLCIKGKNTHTASNNLYIEGYESHIVSGNLFVKGHEPLTASDNLHAHGHELIESYIPADMPAIDFGNSSDFLSSGVVRYNSVDNLSTTKFVIAYDADLGGGDDDYGAARIGVVSGTDVVFGAEEKFSSTLLVSDNSVAALSESKFVVAYDKDGPKRGAATIGVVSGTDITYGTESLYASSGSVSYNSIAKIDANKFVLAYRDHYDSYHGKARIGTVSGTDIAFGAETEFLNTGNAVGVSLAMLSETKFVVVYQDAPDSQHGTAKIGTISGTNITFGPEAEFLSTGDAIWLSVTALSATEFVVAYVDNYASIYGAVKIGTVSGTAISFGDETEFTNSSASYTTIEMLSATEFIIVYRGGSNRGKVKFGRVSGTMITLSEEKEFTSTSFNTQTSITAVNNPLLDNRQFVVAYGTTKIGTIIPQLSNLITRGSERIAISGPFLSIIGHTPLTASGSLYVKGLEQITTQEGPPTVYAWGRNNNGQTNVPDDDFVAIGIGNYHSLGLKLDGSVSGWGYNLFNQCDIPAPNSDFTMVKGGEYHSLGLKTDGSIVAWGQNDYGQTDVPAPNTNFIAIAAGGAHSLGLKLDGSIIAWGRNDLDQCEVPAPNTDFTAISAGAYHSLGLKSNGSGVGWGHNTSGQIDIPSPNTDFVAVVAGYIHSLGLKTDGSLVAWGSNEYGQCDVPAPNTNFIASAGAFRHSFGLKIDGSVVAWGQNNYGKLDIPAPNINYTDIEAGTWHTLGIKPLDTSPPLLTKGHISSSGDIALFLSEPFVTPVDSAGLFIAGHRSLGQTTTVIDTEQRATKKSGPYDDINYGLDALHIVGHDPSGISHRTAIAFDISSIPSGSIIQESHLEVHTHLSASGQEEFRSHHLHHGWVNYEVTWNSKSSGIPWDTPGGDYVSGVFDTWTIDCVSGQVKTDIVVTNVIQDAVNSGLTTANILLKEHVEASVTMQMSGDPILVVISTEQHPDVDLFTEGHITIASGLDCVMIEPTATISGGLNLCINGVVPQDPDSRSCPILDPTASIQISSELIGIYQSRIDALINQLGKNILLEFAKVEVRCPNCLFDTMRGRSNGIYRSGGPRPFARGRRCPWCKGEGFEVTDNNKCIKALLKWNPKEAANYGLTLSDSKGIVRIKTFLTEFDDLKRAITIIANYDMESIAKLRVKLVKGPMPVGLREDRYCISFWELIDE